MKISLISGALGAEVRVIAPATLIPKNITVRLDWDIFFILENIVLMNIPHHKPQIYAINILKSWDLDRIFDRKSSKNHVFLTKKYIFELESNWCLHILPAKMEQAILF